ncbi:hydrolase [Aliidiomarina minuta]|uniref:Hydrolase n=1 Tax=Aliidiomarina minuta TaxID=880057 RepID=A0A432W9E2_9GAMM|nr:hydrolase [Aliidiomarina minuta]RUO26744.1 hydrolase [Aliidiomarina minuta]
MPEICSTFIPHPLLSNCHLQTLWSRLSRYPPQMRPYWQSLALPDGDFIDLAWSESPETCLNENSKPLLILFHGLEGSVRSPYADHLMCAARAKGWHAVTMHFRGCSGRINRTHRAYHSGDTTDARFFINWLAKKNPLKPLAAASFSLGGNMLVKLLGEDPTLPLRAAVAASAPLALGPSSFRIDQGFSRVYRGHLLGSLKRKVAIKMDAGLVQGFIHINKTELQRLDNFRQFDDKVTAPLHGFANVDDYYDSCSGLRFLPQVRHSLLIIHAADDPFTCEASFATPDQYHDNVSYELAERGGHVGFIGIANKRPAFWLSSRILSYLQEQLCASPIHK